jgi:GNAT superfamily N-acetyltransferase
MSDFAQSGKPATAGAVPHIRLLDEADLPDVVCVHLGAFPDSAITALGSGAAARYYRWQLTGPHECVALGLFVGTEIAGFCFGGQFRGALTGFVRRNRGFLAWRVLTRPWLLLHREFRSRLSLGSRLARSGTRGTTTSDEPRRAERARSFGILSIAVHPRFQGAGLAMLLMSESERIARSQGYVQMHLTVHPRNTPAVRVYERCGWVRVTGGDRWTGSMRKALLPTVHTGGT